MKERRASKNFDLNTYMNDPLNADLKATFGNNKIAYVNHYLTSGVQNRESRSARPLSEYKALTAGTVYHDDPDIAIIKLQNKKKKNYYIAIKKQDNKGNAMNAVTFNLSFYDPDLKKTRTFAASWKKVEDRNVLNGIYSGYDCNVSGDNTMSGHKRTDNLGVSVVYLGKFSTAPTNITVTENWVVYTSEDSPWQNGRAVLYTPKGDGTYTSTNVYKRDYKSSDQGQSKTVTAYTSAAAAQSHAADFTFTDHPKPDYYVAIYKKNDNNVAMANVTFDLKVNGTETTKGLTTGTNGIAVKYLGKFETAPTVQVKENWEDPQDHYRPVSGDYKTVSVYTSESAATQHAKDAAQTFINTRYNYYIGIYKKNDKGEAMSDVTFNVKVNGVVKVKALTTGTDGTAVLDLGKFDAAPTVEVEENWTDSNYVQQKSGYYPVTVYKTQSGAQAHAKDSKHTWINTEKVYVSLLKKSANESCTDNNPNYNLSGTKYALYRTQADAAADTNRMHVFTLTSEGKTTAWAIPDDDMNKNTTTMSYRNTTFYLKEVEGSQGKGYEYSSKVTPVTVTNQNHKEQPSISNSNRHTCTRSCTYKNFKSRY
jgi:hypothetical protein